MTKPRDVDQDFDAIRDAPEGWHWEGLVLCHDSLNGFVRPHTLGWACFANGYQLLTGTDNLLLPTMLEACNYVSGWLFTSKAQEWECGNRIVGSVVSTPVPVMFTFRSLQLLQNFQWKKATNPRYIGIKTSESSYIIFGRGRFNTQYEVTAEEAGQEVLPVAVMQFEFKRDGEIPDEPQQ